MSFETRFCVSCATALAPISQDEDGGAKIRLHFVPLKPWQRAAQQHVDTDEGRKDEQRARRAQVLQHAHARPLALFSRA